MKNFFRIFTGYSLFLSFFFSVQMVAQIFFNTPTFANPKPSFSLGNDFFIDSTHPNYSDYVVTKKGDTIRGRVHRGNLYRNAVAIRINGKKTLMKFDDIVLWKHRNLEVTIVEHNQSPKHRFTELRLISDGPLRVYDDYFFFQKSFMYFKWKGVIYDVRGMKNAHAFWQDIKSCPFIQQQFSDTLQQEFEQMKFRKKELLLEELAFLLQSKCNF